MFSESNGGAGLKLGSRVLLFGKEKGLVGFYFI
jgi:hypothetical protein